MGNRNKKGKVLKQLKGYRIRQMVEKDGDSVTTRYGIYAGKRLVNNDKGFKTFDEALKVATDIVDDKIKAKTIRKNRK